MVLCYTLNVALCLLMLWMLILDLLACGGLSMPSVRGRPFSGWLLTASLAVLAGLHSQRLPHICCCQVAYHFWKGPVEQCACIMVQMLEITIQIMVMLPTKMKLLADMACQQIELQSINDLPCP